MKSTARSSPRPRPHQSAAPAAAPGEDREQLEEQHQIILGAYAVCSWAGPRLDMPQRVHLRDRFNEIFRDRRPREPGVAADARAFVAMAGADVGRQDED